MDVQSLAFRTELALLRLGGSTVEDRGDFLVIRTPANPTYFWGNFLLLPTTPAADLVDHWQRVHRQEFPDAGHVTLGIDRPAAVEEDTAVLRAAGMRVDVAVAMTATAVRPPERRARDAELRPLAGDGDWSQQLDLMLDGEDDDPHVTSEFAGRKVDANRALTEAGHGSWWGAFVDGRLVSSLGIFRAGDGLARFQSVKTLDGFRAQGLAGSLVVAASRHALLELGAQRLVMVADPTYAAIRLYRAVGFTEGPPHLEATRLPGT